MATDSATNEHELGTLANAESTSADTLRETFASRFPGVANPRDGLTLLHHFGYKDGPDLTLCLRMLYPEFVAGRDELAKQLDALCEFVGCSGQVASEGDFWFTTFFLQCFGWRCGAGEWRGHLGRRTEDSSEAWRRRADEAKDVFTAVRAATHPVSVHLAGVAEPMLLKEPMERQLGKLETAMTDSQRWLQDRTTIAAQREETQKAASSTEVSTNGAQLLTPMPGVARVGSASSGIFSSAVHGRARRQHSAKRQGTHYGQAFGSTRIDGPLGALVNRTKSLIASVSSPVTSVWQHLRAAPFSERLGHPTTVWYLVRLLSLLAAAATALAVWEAGPNTSLPEIDSNFWSTLSQNVLSAAGLYCIVIPALQKVKLSAQNPSLFYGFLIASAAGTFVSTFVYIVHTRTSTVLAYVAALTQLLATLQLIVAQGARVQKLQYNVENLEGEVAVLRAERE